MRVLMLALAIRGAVDAPASHRAESEEYRKHRLEELTAPNGWLAVQGLFWLHDGANAAGSDPAAEIRLPARAPKRLGVFTLKDHAGTFTADPAAAGTAAGDTGAPLTCRPRAGG